MNVILSGFLGVIMVLLFVELKMLDGLIYLFDNFIMYSGLFIFRFSDVVVVLVDLNFGVVILLLDSCFIVIIIVMVLLNISVIVMIVFYCNLFFGIGEVDIGVSEGLVIFLFIVNDIWRMLIRINVGVFGILVVYVKIFFSISDFCLDNVVIDFLYLVFGNMFNIFGFL